MKICNLKGDAVPTYIRTKQAKAAAVSSFTSRN